MTQTATLKWIDPAAAITGIEIAVQLQGAPSFTVLTTVQPGVQTASVPDLADGTYTFRAVALNGSARATGVTVTGTAAEAPAAPVAPGDVTGLSVTFA